MIIDGMLANFCSRVEELALFEELMGFQDISIVLGRNGLGHDAILGDVNGGL